MRRALIAGIALLWAAAASAQPNPNLGNITATSVATNTLTVAGVPIGGASSGTYADGSRALAITASDVFAANAARVRLRLLNTDYVTKSGGGGAVMWCRWGTAAANAAVPHGIGSFPLFPGGGTDDQGSGVNSGAVNCIAESGTPILFAEQY
jgi:hypothetical protein